MRFFVAGILLFIHSLCYATTAKKLENFICNSKQPYEFKLAGYTLEVSHHGDAEFPEWCSAVLRKGKIRRTIVREAMSVSILGESGQDINNDGRQELIVESYSGGAHCCWSYDIVSLGGVPKVVLRLTELEQPISFERQDGFWVLEAKENRYDYLRTSHAQSFFPDIYLVLKGRRVLDVSCSHRTEYDKQISESRELLKKLDPQNRAPEMDVSRVDEEVRYNIIAVISSFLYSGRSKESWKALNTYWPKNDRTKLMSELIELKKDGLLKMSETTPCQ